MKKNNLCEGFTILELVIVVIIVGVLMSLALPKFFAVVERSRAQEAFVALATIRGGMERYYVSKGLTYAGAGIANIDTGDPLQGQPNAHFSCFVINATVAGYTAFCQRNTRDGGNPASSITLMQSPTGITRWGVGTFNWVN